MLLQLGHSSQESVLLDFWIGDKSAALKNEENIGDLCSDLGGAVTKYKNS